MEKYNLTQTGQEVQDILDNATSQSDLAAEVERAREAERLLGESIQQNATDIDSIEGKIPSAATPENKLADKEYVDGQVDDEKNRAQGVEGTLQGNIDAEETRAKAAERQNADDIDALEAVVPSGATSENKLTTESYVNDAVATSSATFRGTFNLVSDLHLTLEATHANIATALAAAIATADNNDFAFVQIPTDAETPTVIGSIERYKFNGTDWAYEYTLNNSGFTQAEWDAINSGITSNYVDKLAELPTNAQLTTLLNGKQNTLTFDNIPTEGSANPVKSGGVYSAIKDEETRAKAAEKANADDIDAIEEKIPSSASSSNQLATASDVDSLSSAIEAILLLIPTAASSLNQLADKAFVNSSIATATATFRGTYNLVNDLHLTLAATHAQIGNALAVAISDEDNNDYCFVQIPTVETAPNEIAQTDRYKFNGTSWEYEYTLNNSGFTAAQWAAINSTITSALVAKLSALPTAAELQEALGVLTNGITAINQKIPSTASQANKLVDNASMESYIAQVINILNASFNVTSTDGHITLHITQMDGVITSVQVQSTDIASAADLALKASQADLTALASRVITAEGNITSLTGRMGTAETNIAILQQLYNDLQQSKPVPVTALPSTGQQQGVIYRLAGTTSYSDYMWDGSTWVLMATYNNAIDPRPKKASQNLVTSGGVFDNMGALDVSELNATENPHTLAQYADLSAALAAIPSDYQKGGMSVKFVQSSDNKYVQWRYLLSSTTNANFANVANWQGVDDVVQGGSILIPKGGAVSRKIQDVAITQGVIVWEEGSIDTENSGVDVDFLGRYRSTFIPLSRLRYIYSDKKNLYCIYNSDKEYLGGLSNVQDIYKASDFTTLYDTAAYIRVVEKTEDTSRWEYGITGIVGDSLLTDYIVIPQDNQISVAGKVINMPYSHIYVRTNTGVYKRYIAPSEATSYTVNANQALVMSTVDGTLSVVALNSIDLSRNIVLAVYANSVMHLHPSLATAFDNTRISAITTNVSVLSKLIDSNRQYISLINNNGLVWESGSLTYGEEVVDNNRRRTIGYIPIDNLNYLTSQGNNFVCLYDKDYACVSYTLADWNNLTKAQMIEAAPTAVYLRIVKKSTDTSDIRINIDTLHTDAIKTTQKGIISAIPTNGSFVDIASGLSDIQNVVINTTNFALNRTDRISAVDGMFAKILNGNDLLLKVKVNSGYKLAVNIFDETIDGLYYSGTAKAFNNKHLYSSGWLDGGMEHTLDLSGFYTDKCAIGFTFRGGATISVSDYSSIGFTAIAYRYDSVSNINNRIKNPISYLGKQVSLLQKDNVFNYEKVFGTSGIEPLGMTQSFDCFGDYIFTAQEHDITIFNKQWVQLQQITFRPTIASHSNALAFTDVYYDNNDEFPLLLSSICNNTSKEYGFYVLRVTKTNDVFAITVLNRITSDKPCYSWCCSNKMLYGIAYTNSEDSYLDVNSRPVILGWNMPNLLTQDLELLRANAAIDFTLPYYGVLQDVKYRGGRLYVSMFMYGSYYDANIPRGIWVVNIPNEEVETIIPFYAGHEFEGVMIMDNELYICDRDYNTPQIFNVYKFNF